jgi:hypothetical protein
MNAEAKEESGKKQLNQLRDFHDRLLHLHKSLLEQEN